MQILREEPANFAKLKRPSGDLSVSPTRIANSHSRENGGRNSLGPSSTTAGYFERFRLKPTCRNKSRGANIIQSAASVFGKDICNRAIRKKHRCMQRNNKILFKYFRVNFNRTLIRTLAAKILYL